MRREEILEQKNPPTRSGTISSKQSHRTNQTAQPSGADEVIKERLFFFSSSSSSSAPKLRNEKKGAVSLPGNDRFFRQIRLFYFFLFFFI